jgi:hypothetical protein
LQRLLWCARPSRNTSGPFFTHTFLTESRPVLAAPSLQGWCAEIAGGKLEDALRDVRKSEDNIAKEASANVGSVRQRSASLAQSLHNQSALLPG